MSATTNVILAAGPTVVALAAIGASVRQQRRGFRHDRTMRDLADLRAALDDAADALSDASRTLSGLERGLFTHGPFIREREPERLIEAEAAGERLKIVRGRLALRITAEDLVFAALADAHDATWEAIHAAFAQPPSYDFNVAETETKVRTAHERLIDATRRFLVAAVGGAGVRLTD